MTPEILAEDVVIAVDSTGIKVTNRGEWMREKWKVRCGWIKVHAMIDVETNQFLGLKITGETDRTTKGKIMQHSISNMNAL